ncbi:MAG TPA: methyl-accepting chemotaxis protein, partial [Coriobacteriia bacterium]|nr:methyl-accepting chemotaxis protein [Coriobacteriia bacterium]
MLKKLIDRIRSSFLLKYSLVILGLVFVVNTVQLVVAWLVFGSYLEGQPGLAVDLVIVIGSFAAALVVFLYVFSLIGRRMMAPLSHVVESVRAACDGEIGHKVDLDTKDEFGVLAPSYNQKLDLIVYLITQTQESSNRLAGASSEILSSTEQQASGAAEQAASISQTTATMEELAATYRQIAENANQVVRMAETSLG